MIPCENAYLKKDVRGILCRKAEEPQDGDLKTTAHALCGHQRFCPNQRCYALLPTWEKCTKREAAEKSEAAENSFGSLPLVSDGKSAETREEAAGREIAVKTSNAKGKKKN